jgi:choline dehydrogenase-like flavoprotein
MAMERFFPCDFRPKSNYPEIGESTLPESWPISYEELEPYYQAAEQLFRVHGTSDPLRADSAKSQYLPASPLHPANRELHEFLQSQGLHPYQLPLAYDQVEGCQGCQGFLCDKNCKNDTGKICLEPAIGQYGARLLEECAVLRLEHSGDTVTGVVCLWQDQERTFRANVIVLAAGALQTPAILLRSRSPQWPQGLANSSGMVGKNLMRHYIDLFAIAPKSPAKLAGNLKEIAFNDYYQCSGEKFGTVQSFGTLPPAEMIVEQIEQDLRDGAFPLAAKAFKPFKPLFKPVLGKTFSNRIIFASLLEDLPYLDNQVTLPEEDPDSGKIILKYRIHPGEKARIERFREKIAKAFKPYNFILLKQAENNDRIAHVCGTCRFGEDERNSVLDASNRAHDLSNLYIVDGSFFPSSAGTNPALTIIANALRVADIIVQRK